MRVTIKKMGINGEGIGYIDRLPVFVPGALLNEEAEIKVIERTQRYARAKVEKIIKRSDKRVRPACGIQHRCGACRIWYVPMRNSSASSAIICVSR